MILDAETAAMMRTAPPHASSQDVAAIRSRANRCVAGLNRYPDKDAALRRLDSLLRTRWDFDRRILLIERRHPDALIGWQQVCEWPLDEKGHAWSTQAVLDLLRASDMQRVGGKEWLRRKREASAKVRERNDAAGTERVLAAVDSLSNKQLKEFEDVERAISTGEKIVAHGSDLKQIERMAKAQPVSPVAAKNDAKMCLNPGMHPRVYKRKRR